MSYIRWLAIDRFTEPLEPSLVARSLPTEVARRGSVCVIFVQLIHNNYQIVHVLEAAGINFTFPILY